MCVKIILNFCECNIFYFPFSEQGFKEYQEYQSIYQFKD